MKNEQSPTNKQHKSYGSSTHVHNVKRGDIIVLPAKVLDRHNRFISGGIFLFSFLVNKLLQFSVFSVLVDKSLHCSLRQIYVMLCSQFSSFKEVKVASEVTCNWFSAALNVERDEDITDFSSRNVS